MTRGRGPSRRGAVESLWFGQSSLLITMSLSAEQLHKEGMSAYTAFFPWLNFCYHLLNQHILWGLMEYYMLFLPWAPLVVGQNMWELAQRDFWVIWAAGTEWHLLLHQLHLCARLSCFHLHHLQQSHHSHRVVSLSQAPPGYWLRLHWHLDLIGWLQPFGALLPHPPFQMDWERKLWVCAMAE